MPNRRIAVVTPVLNDWDSLAQLLAALGRIAPSAGEVSVVVVDDGSTDNTREVLSRYDNRVRYVYQQNAGPAAARNHGAALSTADFLTFLDSDDTILPTKLEKQVAHLQAQGMQG